MIIKDYNNN